MLRFWDLLLFWAHILIIVFNLFGWIVLKFRKWHLIVAGITLASWSILGIWYGFGYCFLTDWHWEIKRQLGETGLPASFVKYFIDEYTILNMNAVTVDIITVSCFLSAIILSIYVNYFKRS